eukprot:CAMPEP_0178446666 /NCGR_PEP_ID=MMETSP0689_2-20121128/40943_1 /TAXON_ID=160604 /ORGANISM="Amphidinium massartii, Strain CS-259" /LENGTH=334 /DNA_ID=CAMNT_0020071541 /DNA_START=103 /DNA_END=1107 /DNA_ORIENTATION=+
MSGCRHFSACLTMLAIVMHHFDAVRGNTCVNSEAAIGNGLLQHSSRLATTPDAQHANRGPSAAALHALIADDESKACSLEDKRLIGAVATLLDASVPQLKNTSFVADLIRQVGLVEDPRPLYGSEAVYQLNVTSDTTLGEGIGSAGMYQLPEQMACALFSLSELNIKTFLEVGIYTGWTGVFMTAYLSRFTEDFVSVGVDIDDYQSSCVKDAMKVLGRDYVEISPEPQLGAEQLLNAATGLVAEESSHVDLCFIDGDHSYEGVHHDVLTLLESCKYIMLHDVIDRDCPGVREQWQQLIHLPAASKVWECFQQPAGLPELYLNTSSLGIGIVKVA